jgi:DNA end-binding protein Ku
VTDEEMRALAPKATRTIEIEDFVDLDDIDPVFFEQPYYLAPDPNALKPYRLLVEAMTDLRKVAIGRFVMRAKEHLVAIRPVDGVLCLETMRYADEIVPANDVVGPIEEGDEPSERELAMARQLVESLATEFDPEKYHDTYREELLALIERKAAGEEIVARPVVEETGKVLDLMAALEASLARAGRRAEDGEAPEPDATEGSRPRRAPAGGGPRDRTADAASGKATRERPAKRAAATSPKPEKKTTRAKRSA